VVASKEMKKIAVDAHRLQKEHARLSHTFHNIVENMVNRISMTSRMICEFQQKA
jgi:predicted small metal-binding protein